MQRKTTQFVVTQVGQAVLVATGQPNGHCTEVKLYNLGSSDLIITALRSHWSTGNQEQAFRAVQYLCVSAGDDQALFTPDEAADFGVWFGGDEFGRNENVRLMVLELALPTGAAEMKFQLSSGRDTLAGLMVVQPTH